MLTLASHQTYDPDINVRGLRVDIGYLYNLYPGKSVTQIAETVVSRARANGVNTLFIYAYNPVYGAIYRTNYPSAPVESGFGRQNILNHFALEAKKSGMKVVASVPANNFKYLWEQKPAWRAKAADGSDYLPIENTYLLSAWHPEFRVWLTGFYKDLIINNPHIDGLEIVEPFIDLRWQKESDYNPVATSKFKRLYPNAKLGDDSWLQFRAQGLTDLISIMNSTAHFYSKSSYLVFTWPVQASGKLFEAEVSKNQIGLDIDGILRLTGTKKLDYLTGELIWQQWRAEYGTQNFSPAWTKQASLEFIDIINLRTKALIHVEITPFMGPQQNVVSPSASEFTESLNVIRELNIGVDVYDYSQIESAGLWDELLAWL